MRIDYNKEQWAAIDSDRNTTIVPAGPGSGKSRTLVGRVIRLVKCGIDPARIVILTFTNGGADVFSQRLSDQGIRGIGYMGTLHGYGMKIIQRFGKSIGYRPNTVSIVTEEAKMILLEEINETLGKKLTKKALLAPPETTDQRLIWAEYGHRIKRANMVDYDGILTDTLLLLKLESVKNALDVSELLVDERQDSGLIDRDIYWEIPAKSRFFVGDIDQCIYAFRGAAPEFFLSEIESYGAFPLELNYRSDFQICNAANKLIAHNRLRADKKIVPVSELPGTVAFNEYAHEGDEIYGVWSEIKQAMANPTGLHPIDSDEIAVLARTNMIADKARETLRGLGLIIKGGQRVRVPSDWPFVITCLSMMVDPANDLHAESFLRARGDSNEKIKEWKLKALQENKTLATAATLPNMRPASVVDGLQNLVLLGVSDESMELVRQRAGAIPGDEDITLSDLLTDLFRTDKWENEDKFAGVTVSTIHAAKGKEWAMVFVIGMEEGIFPVLKKDDDARIGAARLEEERRLCFVAVTRAKRSLILSCAQQRTMFFKTHDQTKSRFIVELMGWPQ